MKDISRQIARKSVEAIVEKQGLDPVVLEVRELTDIADYFIIASGRTNRQVEAIQEAILENLKEAGFRPLGVEGKRGGEWILMDYGAAIIHIFTPETRNYYRLESLWISAPLYDAENFLKDS
ncbi:MAG: ribosome silencing factor [Proteobacteria bacterium]|nr:ribosome silencing factor [Pseudomonadota bacterium]